MDILSVLTCFLIFGKHSLVLCDEAASHYISYQGYGDLTLTCNGSDVINITGIELTNHPTYCCQETCTLSENDTLSVEKCNHKSTCQIPVHNLNGCITKKGFYNVRYSCQTIALKCDFESSGCNIEHVNGTNKWNVTDAQAVGNGFKDHTTGLGSGHFMFLKIQNKSGTSETKLRNLVYSSPKQCLTFYYWMKTDSQDITVYIEETDGINVTKVNGTWKRFEMILNDKGDYFLRFKATGNTIDSIFIIDDISIINTDCPDLKVRECNFESDWCNWTDNGGNYWKRIKGRTPTSNTGPSEDHTTISGHGYYIYMESTYMGYWDRTNLTSPIYEEKGTLCFEFWYYMYGYGQLNVYYQSVRGNSTKLHTINGDKGQRWHFAHLNINTDDHFQIIFEGQRGYYTSDKAIDDISLLPGNCTGYVQYKKSRRHEDVGIVLHECTQSYMKNINIYFDPLKQSCHNFLNDEGNHICNVSSNQVMCDGRELLKRRPSCFNLNTLMINYTCNENANVDVREAGLDRNDSVNIGLVAGAVSAVLLVCLVFVVLLIIYRRRRNTDQGQKRKDRTLPPVVSGSGSLPPNRPENASNRAVGPDATSHNPLYGQSHATTSKHSHSKPGTYPKEAGVNEYNQSMYAVSSDVNQSQDDDYAETVAGIYDISGSNRHKVNDPIYSYDHSADETYDTSYQGRRDNPGDDTYSHMFGKQTEDDYEIAGS